MDRNVLLATVLFGVAACSGTEGVASTASSAPAPVVTTTLDRTEVERDLTLTLRRKTTDAFEIDHRPGFEMVLTNRSTTRSYPVVLSNDGSESGWREPHVFYTVERRTSASGPWQPVHAMPMIRCGNYAAEWEKDVVSLDPGKDVVLDWTDFHNQWNLEGASHVRVTAHYVYGDHARDLRKVPPVLHSIPPYALASNAMELAVDPPITLALTLKGPFPKPGEPLSPAVEVTATNGGKTVLPFASADTGANLALEIEGEEADGATARHRISTGHAVDDAHGRLAPGERKAVVGAAKADQYSELPAGFRARRVRALLHIWWYTDEPTGKSDERTPRSAWVDVK